METRPTNSLGINIPGTKEHAELANQKLLSDIQIINERPFLDRMDRINLQTYYGTWACNHIIALFNYDQSGNFLPEAYSAPTDITRMLYPIDDLINFERQGTLIIDREQWRPELKALSFFIYMVDEELYNELHDKQNFLGETAPTFMFFRHDPNGIRVFKDYFALARHLRKQRFISYCLGPRTAFYLRFYLHEININVVEDEYAYGSKEDATIANKVITTIQECCAFRQKAGDFNYTKEFTIDDYKLLRTLSSVFKVNLPKERHFKHTTRCIRYKKQKLANEVLILKKSKLKKYAEFGVRPCHHAIQSNGHWYFFVWDTRRIQVILPDDMVQRDDFMHPVDNGLDLVMTYSEDRLNDWNIVLNDKTNIAVQLHNMNTADYGQLQNIF